MRLGMLLRNSGPVATADFIAGCAGAAEAAGLDDLWVLDHIAIPPDDAEGSGGRYLDALATKYDQYRTEPPNGPVIVVTVDTWTGWAYAGA